MGRQEGEVGGGRGGPKAVFFVGPFPVRGTGSCGPAVSTRGLPAEGAAKTATMGGKNKQRTKGNLRVSAGWPSRPGSPLLAAADSTPCARLEDMWSVAVGKRVFACRV